MSSVSPRRQPLLERENESNAVDDAIAAAIAGDGHTSLFEGAAGIGKTSILLNAASRAKASGVEVRWSCGDELETDFPWGMTLQLFGDVVRTQSTEPLRGAAQLASPIFDQRPEPRDTVDPFPILHGLHWLTINLSDSAPQLLMLDDVHWGDPQSLRFICYLLRRLDGLRVSVLLAGRPGEPVPAEITSLLAKIRADTATRVMPLAALDDLSIGSLVRAVVPHATDAFCGAMATAVAGNPFLCREVLDAVLADGAAPTDDAATRLRDLRPEGIRNSILVRLGRLGHDATMLATAVAVLGSAASPARARRLADLDDGQATAAVDLLVANGILSASPRLSFVHPIVREVVYSDLGPARRDRDHLRAARLLHGEGVPAAEVAQHLLSTTPCGDDWAIAALRDAAATSARHHAPHNAAALLRAALDACHAPAARAEILLDLGRVEAATGATHVMERYREALVLLPGTAHDPRIALDLGLTLYASGRFDDAAIAFRYGIEALESVPCDDRDPVVDAQLLAGLDMSSMLTMSSPSPAPDRITSLINDPPDEPSDGDRILLALAAGRAALGVDPGDGVGDRQRVLRLARAALAAGNLPDELGAVVLEPLTLALTVCDEFASAVHILDAALERASERGQAAAYATLLPIRGFVNIGRGHLASAAADAHDALRLADEVELASRQTLAPTRYVLAIASLERGELDAAIHAVTADDKTDSWCGSPLHGWYLDAVGRVALAQGRHADALAAFLDAGERFSAAGGMGAYCPWRSGAALAAYASGASERATTLAAEELQLAEAFGAPRGIASALRCRARMCDDIQASIDMLQSAQTLLQESPAVLERAHVDIELGGALRRSGRRRDARVHLRTGMETARQCGAHALVADAVAELEASGARRPRLAITGVEALTPAELRVAQLAATGRTNREIAQSLFVTRKTVEVHLSSTYRKMGISSRTELAGALNQPSIPG